LIHTPFNFLISFAILFFVTASGALEYANATNKTVDKTFLPDIQLVGDFTVDGHDEVLFINTDGIGGRVLINDYANGTVPGHIDYLEDWGQSPRLDGWHNPGDIQLVGDFAHKGHDQVLFINADGNGGRVMIADFSSGTPPAHVKYLEDWGQSPRLDGWHD
jgi:hypothetical protein